MLMQLGTLMVKGQIMSAKAELVRKATAAVLAVIAALSAGVDLPPGLLQLINGDV